MASTYAPWYRVLEELRAATEAPKDCICNRARRRDLATGACPLIVRVRLCSICSVWCVLNCC